MPLNRFPISWPWNSPSISLLSFVSYAHLDGHEDHNDVMSKNKGCSADAEILEVISNTEMTTVNTVETTGLRPDRSHKISEISTDLDFEGAITATDMTVASEKSRYARKHFNSATLTRKVSSFWYINAVTNSLYRLTHKFSVLSTDTGFENLIQATDMTALTSFSSTSSSSTVVGEGAVKEVKDFVATKVRAFLINKRPMHVQIASVLVCDHVHCI